MSRYVILNTEQAPTLISCATANNDDDGDVKLVIVIGPRVV